MRNVYYQSNDTKKPNIVIYSPNEKFVSTDDKVKIEGKISNAKNLFINNKKVKVSKNGNFSVFLKLQNKDDYNQIAIIASKDDIKTKVDRSIYYQYKKPNSTKKAVQNYEKNIKNHIPSVVINYPQDNFVTYKNHVVINGNRNTDELYINNRLSTLMKMATSLKLLN